MCFSAKSSKRALVFGILCGLALMLFGNKDYKNTNTVLGLFFIFVTFMQYIEYLIWSDLDCKNGNNKIAGIIGPLLNYLQPTLLFILIMLVKNTKDRDDVIPLALNTGYVAYIMGRYYQYLKKNNLCSKLDNGHLLWPWGNRYDYLLFNIVLIFNILYYFQSSIGIIALSISYFYFFLSATKFNRHLGELWCYMVTNVPLIILILQKTVL